MRKLLVGVCIFISINTIAQSGSQTNPINATININTNNGHSVVVGSSGFNVRIGDKVWSYKHPDFIAAVNELKPGWLRYWSGTAGDAFSAATGMYDKEYINMFDKGEAYDKLYQFVEVKGPHRIIDLYQLLGTINAKLVVTVNAFTETPEMTAALASFCKNNNINVACWQFCNEPYFYIPSRQRYWWNDGYDYAQKMKPHADAILKIFPEAKLALNFTWDGIWGFMKEINQYQKDKGAFWNVFSKHSYAPHTGKEESFDDAYKRMNTKLLEVTGPAAMQEIEKWTKKDIPMLITEFGVWNKPLNGIMSAIYNAEYTLRQLAHKNTWLIGSHEISNKAKPAKNLNKQILEAYENNTSLNTINLSTGVTLDDEGKALQLVHEATNNANYVWQTNITGAAMVQGLKNELVEGTFALAFKGVNQMDYLIITNRSNSWHNMQLLKNNIGFNETTITRSYIMANSSTDKDVSVQTDVIKTKGVVMVPPNAVMLLQWKNNQTVLPQPTNIYKTSITNKGIVINWSKQTSANGYLVNYTNVKTNQKNSITINNNAVESTIIKNITANESYKIEVLSKNKNLLSVPSNPIYTKFALPEQPSIFKVAPNKNQITVFWHSVANANGYTISVTNTDGSYKKEFDANNVFGFKMYDLAYNTPYNVVVTAYNGLGNGQPSKPILITCKQNIPLPPSNISAIENSRGAIVLNWNKPKTDTENTKYKLYRGEQLHQYQVLKDELTATNFIDETAVKNKNYFYTVKSYTVDGECSFYPNSATIIRNNKKTSVEVESITKSENGYIVKVNYSNIPTDGESEFGILISDVSYLNGEETKFTTTNFSNGSYTVVIPFKATIAKSVYAIKAYVQTNGGSPVFSLPPHKEIKIAN